MVRAAMTKRELVGLVTGRESEQLVSETDPENRHAAEQLADDGDLVLERLGVAGPFDRSTPSKRSSSSADTSCGNTVTAAPAPASRRRIERLQP